MNYIVEANIGIAFLYGMYVLILGRENDFRKQRIALLCIPACSLMFPLVSIGSVAPVDVTAILLPEAAANVQATTPTDYLLIAYSIVACLVALPFLVNGVKLYATFKARRRQGSFYVVESNGHLPSWSFFKLIFIGRANELTLEDKDLVIKHEMLHGRLLHSVDMLLITVLCIVCWFNPFLWLLRRSLAKVHEYEVDDIIAEQNGADGYSILLAKTALAQSGFLLTHHFNQSFILKRISMINTMKNKISSWKLAGLGVAIVMYFVAVACNEQVSKEVATAEPLTIVDDTAMPKQGMTAFYQELADVLQYPEQARQMGIQGKVYVEFVVNENGKLSNFNVVKGIGAGCDAAAVSAMEKMKDWNPGKQKGKFIAQKMVLPISFKLN